MFKIVLPSFRLVHVVESIPSRIKEATKKTELSKHSDNIALEAMEQPILDFPGMTCFAYATNIFSCQGGIINQTAPIITKQQVNIIVVVFCLFYFFFFTVSELFLSS